MNLIGLVNSMLTNIVALAGANDPQMKITPPGFLKMLLENSPSIHGVEQRQGMKRTIEVRYMQRGTITDVDDVDDCSTKITPDWKTQIIPNTQFNKIGIRLDDELVRQLELAAAQKVSVGTPPAEVYSVLYQTLRVKINGLIQAINSNLLAAQNTAWGMNVAYGSALPQTLTFGGMMGTDKNTKLCL